MRCPIQRGNPEILLDYSARKLSAGQRIVLERHMEDCEECGRFARAQSAVWEALDVWEAQPPAPEFDRKLYAAIEASERSPWWRKLTIEWLGISSWRPVATVVAACLALVAGVVLYTPKAVLTLPKAPVIENVELDQVEATLEDLEMLKLLSAPAASQDI